MARSVIAITTDDGYRAIYCHCDGQPEHNNMLLRQYYQFEDRSWELLALGDINSLGRYLTDEEKEDGKDGKVTEARCRDMGWSCDETKCKMFGCNAALWNYAHSVGAKYIHMRRNGGWWRCLMTMQEVEITEKLIRL